MPSKSYVIPFTTFSQILMIQYEAPEINPYFHSSETSNEIYLPDLFYEW